MLTTEETTLVRDLAITLGKNAELVVGQYATWFVASAICWITLGIVICFAATLLRFSEKTDVPLWGQLLIRCAIVFFGSLFIINNVPDLASPAAAATHQLLRDVRRS